MKTVALGALCLTTTNCAKGHQTPVSLPSLLPKVGWFQTHPKGTCSPLWWWDPAVCWHWAFRTRQRPARGQTGPLKPGIRKNRETCHSHISTSQNPQNLICAKRRNRFLVLRFLLFTAWGLAPFSFKLSLQDPFLLCKYLQVYRLWPKTDRSHQSDQPSQLRPGQQRESALTEGAHELRAPWWPRGSGPVGHGWPAAVGLRG